METPPHGKVAIRPRLLRYYVCLHLHGCREPLTVRELVDAFSQSPFWVPGRTSKAISDTLRWALPRGWAHAMGRGMYRGGEIPESTARYMRARLDAAEAAGIDPSLRETRARRAANARLSL